VTLLVSTETSSLDQRSCTRPISAPRQYALRTTRTRWTALGGEWNEITWTSNA